MTGGLSVQEEPRDDHPERFPALNPGEWVAFGDTYVEMFSPTRGRDRILVDRLPFRDLSLEWLKSQTPIRGVTDTLNRARCLLRLGQFLEERRRKRLTQQAHAEFLMWLREQPGIRGKRAGAMHVGDGLLSESTRRQTAQNIAQFYAFALGRGSEWEQATYEAIRARSRSEFMGRKSRQQHRKAATALDASELRGLLRACRMEMEECERVLAAHTPGDRLLGVAYRSVLGVKGHAGGIDPNPYVAFTVLAALEIGLRAAEMNVLDRGDLERAPRHIYAHAPNKEPRYLPVTPEVERALRLVLAWSDELRPYAPDADALMLYCKSDPRVAVNRDKHPETKTPGKAKVPRRLNSQLLNLHWLPRFYAKYFGRTEVVGGEAHPVLAASRRRTGGQWQPFYVGYAAFRAAGLTAFARIERNKEVVRRHAGHTSLDVTAEYYLVAEEEERQEETARFLLPWAERLRMRMESRVAGAPTDAEREGLGARGALVPILTPTGAEIGGHCHEAVADPDASALAAGARPGCVRATDCRMCANFRIHVDRREVFVRSRDGALARAEHLVQIGNLRQAENLRSSAALDEAVIGRIDEYTAEEDQ